MAQAKIDIPVNQIADLCRQHHIPEPALFGPVWRDDFGPESDVDVLIEFEPEADENLTPSDLAGMAIMRSPFHPSSRKEMGV